jgi:hypothetical protein
VRWCSFRRGDDDQVSTCPVVAFVPGGRAISSLDLSGQALGVPVRKLRGRKVEVGGCVIRQDLCAGHRYLVLDGDQWRAVQVTSDLSASEHAYADHRTYLFPVDVELVGPVRPVEDGERSRAVALIYADDCVLLTLHELCYDLWSVGSGCLLRGTLWHQGWRVSAQALEEVRARVLSHGSPGTKVARSSSRAGRTR